VKKILIAGIIVLIASVIVTAFIFLFFMTDPIPPQVRAGWYLPQQDIIWTPYGSSSTQERLILTGHQDAPAPQFPALSSYSRNENYTHVSTNDQYMIATWYFNDDRKFLESQKNLVGFLETDGKISSVELNITDYIMRNEKSAPGIQDSQNRHTIHERIHATGYDSVTASGYFFTVTIPGVGALPVDSDYTITKEYYIVYYGTTTPANRTSRTPLIEEMIAETYRYDHMPSVGALV